MSAQSTMGDVEIFGISCKVMMLSILFEIKMFQLIDLPGFDFVMPVFFYSIDEVETTVDFIFGNHVPKVGILFTSVVFIHVQNAIDISKSFHKVIISQLCGWCYNFNLSSGGSLICNLLVLNLPLYI